MYDGYDHSYLASPECNVMKSWFHPCGRIRRRFGIASGLGLAALLLVVAAPPVVAEGGISFVPDGGRGATAVNAPVGKVVTMGDGTRVALQPDGRGTAIQPIADASGPGLLLTSRPAGTTLQSTGSDSRPTVLAGVEPREAADAGDLIPLHLSAIGRDGRPAVAFAMVYDVETGAVSASRQLTDASDSTCSTAAWAQSDCVVVPPGTYSVMAFVQTNTSDKPGTPQERTAESIALVGEPQTKISKERTVTFDARRAIPMTVRTPGRRSEVSPGGAMQIGYTRTADNGVKITQEFRPTALIEETFYQQPTQPVATGRFDTLARLRLEAPDITMRLVGRRSGTLHPAYYDPVWFSDVSKDYPVFDGVAKLRVVDIGHATRSEVGSRSLRGAVAVAERSDSVSVPRQSAAAAAAGAAMIVIYNDQPGSNDDPGETGVKLSIPTLRLSHEEGLRLRALSGGGLIAVTGESASPYLYDLVIKEHGHIPRDLSYRYRTDQLAMQVREFHGQPTVGATFSEAAYEYQPGDEFSISTMFPLRDGPRSRIEYRIPDPDTRWTYAMATPESPYNNLFPGGPTLRMLLSDPQSVAYRRGERIIKPIGSAPIGAGLAQPVQRAGDLMRIRISGFVDADGNRGDAYSLDGAMKTMLTISADGKVVGQTAHLPSGTAQLPPGKTRVSIGFTAENTQAWAELSTYTQSRWTFDSATTDGTVVTEPLIIADYDVDVDLHNRLRSIGRRPQFVLHLAHQQGSPSAKITNVRMEASYDGGASWEPAGVASAHRDNGYLVTLPRGNGNVSVRLHAEDADGSAFDQTIIGAFFVG